MTSQPHPPLAILGGRPRFEHPLHVGRPNLGEPAGVLDRISQALADRRLTNDGPFVREFEARIAERLGVAHCIAVCNGTLGLELVCRALGLTGEVIVPSFTFVATVHALWAAGLRPVFCDVDPESHTLDPRAVEPLIGPETSAVLGVHLWGNACDVRPLEELAAAHNLRLFFDAAHSFASGHAGRMIGTFGEAEVFSFHATKFVHSCEGGAIITSSDALAAELRLMRNFGFAGYDRVVSWGTNAKLSELHAAMGLASLENLNTFVEINRRNYLQYRERLAGLPGVRLVAAPRDPVHNYQYVVVEVDAGDGPLTRDELHHVLQAEGVLARRYFSPGCHQAEPYRAAQLRSGPLEVTNRLCGSLLQLPTGTGVSTAEIDQIGEIVAAALSRAAEVKAAVSAAGRT